MGKVPFTHPEDFGAARLDDNGATVTTRQILTTRYAAPEFAVGAASLADTWSLGVILYEMATGHQMDQRIVSSLVASRSIYRPSRILRSVS